MRAWPVLAAAVLLASCVGRPEVISSQRSPDGRLVARIVRANDNRLLFDVGLANDGPFTTIVELAESSDPFPLRWTSPDAVVATLPCATTTLRGALVEQVRLPETPRPITVSMTRPARCRLPLQQPR